MSETLQRRLKRRWNKFFFCVVLCFFSLTPPFLVTHRGGGERTTTVTLQANRTRLSLREHFQLSNIRSRRQLNRTILTHTNKSQDDTLPYRIELN